MDTDDLKAGLRELDDAVTDYDDAWAYYRGKSPERYANTAVARALAATSGRHRINIGKVPVNVISNRLVVAGVTALTVDGTPWPEADAALQGVWAANGLDKWLGHTIRRASAFGDAYWVIWPKSGDGGPKSVDIAYNSPTNVRMIYSSEDERVPVFLIKRWAVGGGRERADLYYPDRIERWVSVRDQGGDTKWAPYSDQQDDTEDAEVPAAIQDWPIRNPWGRIPAVHFRNDMPYGTPEHEATYGPQDAINKLSTTMAHGAEFAGFPQRWILQEADAAVRGNGNDTPDWDDDLDAPSGGQDRSRLRVGPAEILEVYGRSAGQWNPADPAAAFLAPATWYMRMAAATSETPFRHFDTPGNPPSGESLRVEDAPTVRKAIARQLYYGEAISVGLVLALRMLGFEDARVAVRWTHPGAQDDAATWSTCALKIAAGVPVRVALLETGLYTPTEIDKWFDVDGRGQLDLARQVDVLAKLGQAIQSLAQGVALGAVDKSQVDGIVARILGQASGEDPGAGD